MEEHLTALLEEHTAQVLFFGDIRLTGERRDSLFTGETAEYAADHHLICGNLEGPAHRADGVTRKKAGPAVMQGPGAIERIRKSGFGLITLANNHMLDYGPDGLAATLADLGTIPSIGAGSTAALANRPYYQVINGVKLGFLSVTERQYGTLGEVDEPGCSWINRPGLLLDIRMMRAECNHVILLCHAGLEDVDQPLPEWRALYKRFIDAGASAVVACHPHVPQGWETYKHGAIFYSLGNAAWEPETDFAGANALCLSVRFPLHGEPRFSLRQTVYENGHIALTDAPAYTEKLTLMNETLRDPVAYRQAAAEICREFYETIALPDFFTITGALPGDGWQQLKNAAKLVVRERALNEALLLSMLENETYRWAAGGYLRRKLREG